MSQQLEYLNQDTVIIPQPRGKLSQKARVNPAYDYFFFFESLISLFVEDLRNFDKPNEIVEIEVGNPIFFHSLADTFLNVIYPPLSLENTRFPFQAATLVFSWLHLELALMS